VYLGLPAHLRSDVTRKADLYVFPGEVGIQVKRWLVGRPEDGVIVRQREGRVQLNVCRFPPWYNTVLFVKGADQSGLVGMGWFKRRRLVEALTDAGFQVDFKRRLLFNLFVP